MRPTGKRPNMDCSSYPDSNQEFGKQIGLGWAKHKQGDKKKKERIAKPRNAYCRGTVCVWERELGGNRVKKTNLEEAHKKGKEPMIDQHSKETGTRHNSLLFERGKSEKEQM